MIPDAIAESTENTNPDTSSDSKIIQGITVDLRTILLLFLCENCKPRFSTDDTNHLKKGEVSN